MSTRQAGPLVFFVLVFVLTVPFWVLGEMVGDLPKARVPINLPIAALAAFIPMVAAAVLSYRAHGFVGVKALFAKVADFRRDRLVWYIVSAAVMPVALLLEFMILKMSGAVPEPHISLAALPVFLVMFFVGAVGEELGWQGYVYPLMRARMNALEACLWIGTIWALWHGIAFLQAHRAPEWILWQSLTMLPLRIITAWLFVNAGESVLAAVVFHMMSNVAQFLFPNYGSSYDPLLTFVILGLFALVVVALWGQQTLSRFRFQHRRPLT